MNVGPEWNERIPYTMRPSLPMHGLQQYRYFCKRCKKSADYWLPPPSIAAKTRLPRAGAAPCRCHVCDGRLTMVSQGTLYNAKWRERRTG